MLHHKQTDALLVVLAFALAVLLPSIVSADTLTLQPNATAGKDAYLVSGSPSQNFGVSTGVDIRGDDNRRTLIEFDFSSISSNSKVISAVLKLYVTATGAPPNPNAILYRVNRTWTEGTGNGAVTGDGATWNTYNGTASWTAGGGDFDSQIWANTTIASSNKWYEWNVTALVQNWVNDAYPNYGMLLRTTTTNSGTHTFASSDNANSSRWPILEINYCTPNLVNTSWSSWDNILCIGDQMNQSRSRIQYDSNSCGNVENQTFYEYQLIGPSHLNTSWSEWSDISCLLDNTLNQSRSRIQYDVYGCALNQTFYDYRNTESCDYCTPNLVNTSWSDWQDATACRINDTILQEMSMTQYDSNACGEVENQTFTEHQEITCNYCSENITGPFNTECAANQLIEYYMDVNYATCCAVTGLESDCHINNGTYANQTLTCGEITPAPSSSGGGGGGGGGGGSSGSNGLVYIRGNQTGTSPIVLSSQPETNAPATQTVAENREIPTAAVVALQPTLMQNIMGGSTIQFEIAGKLGTHLVGALLISLILIFASALVKNRELFYVPMLVVDLIKKYNVKTKSPKKFRFFTHRHQV